MRKRVENSIVVVWVYWRLGPWFDIRTYTSIHTSWWGYCEK